MRAIQMTKAINCNTQGVVIFKSIPLKLFVEQMRGKGVLFHLDQNTRQFGRRVGLEFWRRRKYEGLDITTYLAL